MPSFQRAGEDERAGPGCALLVGSGVAAARAEGHRLGAVGPRGWAREPGWSGPEGFASIKSRRDASALRHPGREGSWPGTGATAGGIPVFEQG